MPPSLERPKILADRLAKRRAGFDRALALIGSGKVDPKPLISDTYPFAESIAAFERAAAGRPNDVKLQIRVADR